MIWIVCIYATLAVIVIGCLFGFVGYHQIAKAVTISGVAAFAIVVLLFKIKYRG